MKYVYNSKIKQSNNFSDRIKSIMTMVGVACTTLLISGYGGVDAAIRPTMPSADSGSTITTDVSTSMSHPVTQQEAFEICNVQQQLDSAASVGWNIGVNDFSGNCVETLMMQSEAIARGTPQVSMVSPVSSDGLPVFGPVQDVAFDYVYEIEAINAVVSIDGVAVSSAVMKDDLFQASLNTGGFTDGQHTLTVHFNIVDEGFFFNNITEWDESFEIIVDSTKTQNSGSIQNPEEVQDPEKAQTPENTQADKTTIVATADTSLMSNRPNRTPGAAKKLNIDNNPEMQALLSFDATEFDGQINKVKLRFYVIKGQSTNLIFSKLDGVGSWSEKTANWNSTRGLIDNISMSLGTTEEASAEEYLEVDVTDMFTGPGVYNFLIENLTTKRVQLASSEASIVEQRPTLIIK